MPIQRKTAAGAWAAFAGALIALSGCEVEQTEEGQLPDIDVETEPGQLPEFEQTQEGELPDADVEVSEGGELPEFDVEGPDVDVGTREEQVDVPTDVDVETEERTITVPDVDVDAPDDEEAGRESGR